MKKALNALCLFAGILVVGQAFSMLHSQQRRTKKYVFNLYYPLNSFHALVNAKKLDTQLIKNSNAFYGINAGDWKHGLTPLHILVSRKDATIEQVKALLDCGANPTIRARTTFYEDGSYRLGRNVYDNAIDWEGATPRNVSPGTFFEKQCYGNKEVMNYIFCEIAHKKLSIIAKQQRGKMLREIWLRRPIFQLRFKKMIINKILYDDHFII